jgi:hypothetical protein
MRMLLAATCAAGVAIVVASPATARAPSPTSPSEAAIAQYVEAVPSATGPVSVGEPASTGHAAALPPAVRAKVEKTAGADAPLLLQITQDARFGNRPVTRAQGGPARSETRRRPVHTPGPALPAHTRTSTVHVAQRATVPPPTRTPGPLAAAASTAGSSALLSVALLLVAVTAAAMALKIRRR